jgi:hypothetical protein
MRHDGARDVAAEDKYDVAAEDKYLVRRKDVFE